MRQLCLGGSYRLWDADADSAKKIMIYHNSSMAGAEVGMVMYSVHLIRLTNISSSRLDLFRIFAMRMPLVVAISSRLFTVSPGDSVASNVFSSIRTGENF